MTTQTVSRKRSKTTKLKPVSTTQAKRPQLTAAQLNELQRRLDALRAETEAKLGQEDIEYIQGVIQLKDRLAGAGRLLLGTTLGPVGWTMGVASLGLAHILENMEIGHNVIHGQYDFANIPGVNSREYEWTIVGTSRNWKRAHNHHHHQNTNIIGKDTDYGFGVFRFSEDVEWKPIHLFQPILMPISALFFDYSIALYDLQLTQYILPKSWRQDTGQELLSGPELRRELREFLAKAVKKELNELVLIPALAGPLAPKVAAGNIAAHAVRNLWAWAVIYCGHLPDGTETFTEAEAEAETKGQWYLRQILGSNNFEGGRWTHILSGHLSHQIEHHLFPDIPAWRYREMAPTVKQICEDLGIPYHTGSMSGQLVTVLRRTVQYAVPPRDKQPAWLKRLTAPVKKASKKLQKAVESQKEAIEGVISNVRQLNGKPLNKVA